ncbi:hypothetical protein K437DRAFT_281667 [Tilletiaria anomala UBC 951]|uniref:Uncharacterized protein n=1 Tax=Tilletiaria anomala (strain ATCC 24038 / CBS 436.72 / UBC 951) TaxID=1037660 RepID=A0A066V7X7_TILAU|nr:uncharacterized protein K437DRAFT_281667 [Tilletiaria anomala UBC 951]KDN37596.1 hypothetical protein K437DRAFT_281667 [Tilletiaria anomala UBC 951]
MECTREAACKCSHRRRLARDARNNEQTSHSKAVRDSFNDWYLRAFVLKYLCITGAQAIQYFTPELVKGLRPNAGIIEVQFLTAPVYAVALVALLGSSFPPNLLKECPLHFATASASALAVVAFAILYGVLDKVDRYALNCFVVPVRSGGIYRAKGLEVNCISLSAVSYPSEKRDISQAAVNALGNSALMFFMAIASSMAFILRHLQAQYPYPELAELLRPDQEMGPAQR